MISKVKENATGIVTEKLDSNVNKVLIRKTAAAVFRSVFEWSFGRVPCLRED